MADAFSARNYWSQKAYWLNAYGSQLGDANLDHRVDDLDLLTIELNMGMLDGAEWQDGDFTGDGMVTYFDRFAWLIYQGWSAF